jgi:hypothetical protein
MTSEKLNQANRPFDDSQLQPGMKVYFYKSPSQQEVSTKGRKAKHLAHYHGPVAVTAIPRRRQLELQYEGKTFNRDISLVIPAKDFDSLDEDSFDLFITETVATPSLHVKGGIPKEGELVSSRIVRPKVGSYSRCFESCRISSKLDTSRRPLRRLRTTSIAQFKNDRRGSVRSASTTLGMSVSASMSEGRLTSRPIRTTKTCKSGKEC